MITIRRPVPADWSRLREIRLAALAEAPHAFGSTLTREVEFGESTWRARLSGAAYHVADHRGSWVGLAAGYRIEPDATPEIVSMWVAPTHRGRGVARRLVEAILDWAQADGAERMELWVTETNTGAMRLYEACGFARTGAGQPLPSNPALVEVQLARELARRR